MYRSSLIFVVALALAATTPVPLSACAMLMSLPAECAPPQAPAHCNHMPAQEPATSLQAQPDMSCCQVTSAPLPDAQTKASAPQGAAPAAIAQRLAPWVNDHAPAANGMTAETSLEFSPPDLQPLLCVFLI